MCDATWSASRWEWCTGHRVQATAGLRNSTSASTATPTAGGTRQWEERDSSTSPPRPPGSPAIAQIVDPDLGRDVVSLGMIKDLRISEGGEVAFTFELTTPACPVRDRFKTQA